MCKGMREIVNKMLTSRLTSASIQMNVFKASDIRSGCRVCGSSTNDVHLHNSEQIHELMNVKHCTFS